MSETVWLVSILYREVFHIRLPLPMILWLWVNLSFGFTNKQLLCHSCMSLPEDSKYQARVNCQPISLSSLTVLPGERWTWRVSLSCTSCSIVPSWIVNCKAMMGGSQASPRTLPGVCGVAAPHPILAYLTYSAYSANSSLDNSRLSDSQCPRFEVQSAAGESLLLMITTVAFNATRLAGEVWIICRLCSCPAHEIQ